MILPAKRERNKAVRSGGDEALQKDDELPGVAGGIQGAAALDAFYATEDPWGYYINPEDAKRRAVLLAELPRRDYGTVLEVGCGNGFITRALPGERVLGVDISERAIRYARRHADERVSFEACDLFQLDPEVIGSFDLVVVAGVLYPQYVGTATALARLLIDRLLAREGVLASVHIEAWYRTRFPYLLAKQVTYPYREYSHLLEIYFK